MKTAIYLRLSRDDGNDSESNSIVSQRGLLRKFVLENDLGQIEEFVDDGISGTTFERVGFKSMIAAIEAKRISMVVCKDMSRLGRNNALVSHYTEIYFPERNIRFIAVNDGIDSNNLDDVTMPLRSIMNEYYSWDISRKIHSSKVNQAHKGEFLGNTAPYGYLKDGKHLIVDPVHAPVVREIFEMAAGGKGDDVVMPFRSVINEYYARDISKKCRSVKKSIAYKGSVS
ncbi:hypothetical protein AGMMS49992_30470 [Clostridia bacterium]|nr:hypothetical protein AGMMS49992_30470 [Clostridia bacterium]